MYNYLSFYIVSYSFDCLILHLENKIVACLVTNIYECLQIIWLIFFNVIRHQGYQFPRSTLPSLLAVSLPKWYRFIRVVHFNSHQTFDLQSNYLFLH